MSGLSSHHIAQNIFAELLPYRRRFVNSDNKCNAHGA